MLISDITCTCTAGSGGNGKVSFYKDKEQRGPDGGNGGKGSSIIVIGTTDIYALSNLSKDPDIKGENGQGGLSGKKNGRNAEDIVLKVPVGTSITDTHSNQVFEVIDQVTPLVLCVGGDGGKGNWEYRASDNRTPMYAQSGFHGQTRNLHFNLKLIADCGLIGFPNSGKSSLLKELTNANPKIGSYPFTTLEPNLGELDGKIIADIPGLIEGASEGKGLGIKFLKHIEKVSLLFHTISCENDDPDKKYQQIRTELGSFNPKLLEIPEIILVTKTDLKSEKEITLIRNKLKNLKRHVIPVSILDEKSLQKIKEIIVGSKYTQASS